MKINFQIFLPQGSEKQIIESWAGHKTLSPSYVTQDNLPTAIF